jgi:SAM-dependent methyltransferase
MIRIARRQCPICENNNVDVLHAQKFALPEGHPLSDGYEVVCCLSCGFVYADTAVTQEAYSRFYAQYSKYEDQKTGTGGIEKEWDRKRLEETAGRIAAFLNDTNASVLDVGCANGGLLKSLTELGYARVFGVDPSPVCVENTKRLGVGAELGSLFQPLKHERFDCVVLSHTLEHVQDLKQAAQWIQSVLGIDGCVYIEVPDAVRYADFVDAPFQDFNTEHINHFSMASLQNILRVNAFEPFEWGEKIIPASANKPYPAIFCFAKRSDGNVKIEMDSELKNNIQRYISISRGMLDEIEVRLSAVLSDSKRLIVWGTGQLAMKLLVETSLAQAEIVAFVDSNPINQGKILRGVRVIAPETVTSYSEPILIASTLHQQSIVEQIHKMGLNNKLIFLKE